nr:PREDICTED: uncharacterized protein LOC104151836 [Struthio camelus australis]
MEGTVQVAYESLRSLGAGNQEQTQGAHARRCNCCHLASGAAISLAFFPFWLLVPSVFTNREGCFFRGGGIALLCGALWWQGGGGLAKRWLSVVMRFLCLAVSASYLKLLESERAKVTKWLNRMCKLSTRHKQQTAPPPACASRGCRGARGEALSLSHSSIVASPTGLAQADAVPVTSTLAFVKPSPSQASKPCPSASRNRSRSGKVDEVPGFAPWP